MALLSKLVATKATLMGLAVGLAVGGALVLAAAAKDGQGARR